MSRARASGAVGNQATYVNQGLLKTPSLAKRTVYITDEVFAAVYAQASEPLRNANDLAYLTSHYIIDGHLITTQEKTKQPLRIVIRGALSELLKQVTARKETEGDAQHGDGGLADQDAWQTAHSGGPPQSLRGDTYESGESCAAVGASDPGILVL